MGTPSYWLNVTPTAGLSEKPREGGILIIGSGLSGASVGYWLQQKQLGDLTIVDFAPEKAATFRNCGHILYGTVESMQALVALHGEKAARAIWEFSIGICHDVRDTIANLNIAADYHQDGYLVIAIDDVEDAEVQESIRLLNGRTDRRSGRRRYWRCGACFGPDVPEGRRSRYRPGHRDHHHLRRLVAVGR